MTDPAYVSGVSLAYLFRQLISRGFFPEHARIILNKRLQSTEYEVTPHLDWPWRIELDGSGTLTVRTAGGEVIPAGAIILRKLGMFEPRRLPPATQAALDADPNLAAPVPKKREATPQRSPRGAKEGAVWTGLAKHLRVKFPRKIPRKNEAFTTAKGWLTDKVKAPPTDDAIRQWIKRHFPRWQKHWSASDK